MKQPTVKTSLRLVVGLIILAFCVTTMLYLATISLAPKDNQVGQLEGSQVHTGENLQHSLDLRLARQATYPSSSIGLVQDLGVEEGLKKQIISFAVPVDHLTEYGLLMLPSSPAPAKGYPVIILCHGYINPEVYKTTSSYLSDMEFYAKNGFAVIKPDFRGQGLSSGQGSSDSAYYSMSYNTDLMSLISSIKDTKYLNKDNINLWGHSMGAYIALRASVVSKDVKNTIFVSGPVDSLKKLYLTYIPPSDENNPRALKTRQAVFAKYGTPGEDSGFWKTANPTAYINQTATRFQIQTGELDEIVPPALSEEFDAYLTSLHHSHEYYVYPDGKHSLIAQRNLIWGRSLAYLRKSGGGFIYQSDSMSFQDSISSLLNIDASPLEITNEYLSFGDDISLLMTYLLD